MNGQGSAGAAAPLRALVVDDEETIVEFLTMGLTYEGWAVDVALDGPAALAAAEQRRHDLVILDVMLPGLDGVAGVIPRKIRHLLAGT